MDDQIKIIQHENCTHHPVDASGVCSLLRPLTQVWALDLLFHNIQVSNLSLLYGTSLINNLFIRQKVIYSSRFPKTKVLVISQLIILKPQFTLQNECHWNLLPSLQSLFFFLFARKKLCTILWVHTIVSRFTCPPKTTEQLDILQLKKLSDRFEYYYLVKWPLEAHPSLIFFLSFFLYPNFPVWSQSDRMASMMPQFMFTISFFLFFLKIHLCMILQ